MKKIIVAIVGAIVLIILLIALAGIYKFNYLANQEGYDVDGNKITATEEKTEPKFAADRDFVGLSIQNAQDLADQKGVSFRVVQKNGHSLPATADYRPGRINAAIQDDLVISYTVE